MTAAPRTLPRSFFVGDARDVAPLLLNKVLVRGRARARIVEVEAYAGEVDPASHAYRGPTARNATMFGRPGLLYVYFTYGMHHCANVTCAPEGHASAVLLRAVEPLAGWSTMRQRRGDHVADRDLTNGPAKLCEALAIDRGLDGADLVTADRGVRLTDDGTAPPATPGRTARIGISTGTEHEWRWFVPGSRFLSRSEAHVPRPADRTRARTSGTSGTSGASGASR
jgi:DNA-3-methyladenine glycosylase